MGVVASRVAGQQGVVLPSVRKSARTLWILSAMILLGSCSRRAHEPVTLSYFRLGWSQPDELPTAEPLSQKFIRETGIQLKNLPVPENSLDQLDLSRKILQGKSGPDVLGVDLIWSGSLAPDLMDLRPYLAAELPSLEPDLLPAYTVDGKLVAIPYTLQTGALEYRTDLLRQYGYDHPPRTWDELERMASRIQAGERAKGNKDFWGYVWQGADAEALTCNALEWQVSEGGGQIIEKDRTISVNNPAAIRAWQRAKRWIGWISPPSVVSYRELDSINVFDSGRAAFNRVWAGTTIARMGRSRKAHWRSSLAEGRTSYTSIPGGAAGRAATLGGSGLGVSMHSVHPQEAIALVRFLIRAEVQSGKEEVLRSSSQAEVHDQLSYDDGDKSSQLKTILVNRPSSETGRIYEQVTRDYMDAVHSVLTREKGAPEAAAELEKRLVKITGFTPGPPKTAN